LVLRGTTIGDAGLRQLHGLSALSDLDIEGTQVTQAGIDDLRAALPQCRISWQGKVIEPANAAAGESK
jgi:hypothetical protein